MEISSVQHSLNEFVKAAETALGDHLQSAVLYGSAAEDRLRPTSDVNLVLVLKLFDPSRISALREPLRLAQAAIRLAVLFLLPSEISLAAEFFAVKFADVSKRHRVLYGSDPFESLSVSREALIARARQVLFNLRLRLRAAYAYQSEREEQLVWSIADFSGPLRVCAASILQAEHRPAPSPKEAMKLLASQLPRGPWEPVLAKVSQAREQGTLPAGTAPLLLLQLMDLAGIMEDRAAHLT